MVDGWLPFSEWATWILRDQDRVGLKIVQRGLREGSSDLKGAT